MPTPDKTPRFLIANGEKLTKEEPYVTGPKGSKAAPYGANDLIGWLAPRLAKAAKAVSQLPDSAKPNGEAVAMVTLHPEFLAKSYFPDALFSSVGLRAVGSRARRIEPRKWTQPKNEASESVPETIDLYMAGTAERFQRWATALASGAIAPNRIEELGRLEDIRPLSELDDQGRISLKEAKGRQPVLEAALHVPEGLERIVFPSFEAYAAQVGAEVFRDYRIEVPGLLFVPLRINRSNVNDLAKFSFLRTLRAVARLRSLPPRRITRAMGKTFAPPSEPPLNPSIRVAVLDGGLPLDHGLAHVSVRRPPGTGAAEPAFQDHGLAVTGAVMWGSLHEPPGRLYGSIDHFRVLDSDDAQHGDIHAYRILKRVQDVIETGSHDLCNLSLGPDLPIDDDEVHAWTSTLDALAADGDKLIVAAAGNNGTMPDPLCRIQVPGDGVNCLCVGATDHDDTGWARAPYSAKGPGRRPGITKPDLVAFGGHSGTPFGVVRRRGGTFVIADEMGTSFAAPLVTRAALSLRSLFSASLSPLTLKCILIHGANPESHHIDEVGWGKIPRESELPICPANTARIIYQGTLPPKRVLRARIPVPAGLNGRISISATICYATQVSAADPLNYTNSGVEITYRPKSNHFKINKETRQEAKNPATAPFFSSSGYASEAERRTRHRKWETVLHETKRVEASKLNNPVFDLHFMPRQGVADDRSATPIRYAMVISVHTPKYPDIYERVLAEFPELQALSPITIETRV